MLRKIHKTRVFALVIVASISCGSTSFARNRTPSTISSVEQNSSMIAGTSWVVAMGAGSQDVDRMTDINLVKIAPELLIEIRRHEEAGESDRNLGVIIRSQGPLEPQQRVLIESIGGKIGTILNDIAVANIPAGKIAQVADLEFVLYIEKSKTQYLR